MPPCRSPTGSRCYRLQFRAGMRRTVQPDVRVRPVVAPSVAEFVGDKVAERGTASDPALTATRPIVYAHIVRDDRLCLRTGLATASRIRQRIRVRLDPGQEST